MRFEKGEAESYALTELVRSAIIFDESNIKVFRAKAGLGCRLNGEEVTRVALLLSDPEKGQDTWAVSDIRKLRTALGRRAAELELPPVSLSLVPEGEAKQLNMFQ